MQGIKIYEIKKKSIVKNIEFGKMLKLYTIINCEMEKNAFGKENKRFLIVRAKV